MDLDDALTVCGSGDDGWKEGRWKWPSAVSDGGQLSGVERLDHIP